MRKYALFSVIALLIPSFVFAAGFAKQSLFLSKSPVIEGDTVSIYAVVANNAGAKFTGKVDFKDGTSDIGSVAVTMAAGGAQTVSVSWKPAAGSHSVSASLMGSDGTTAESQSATFAVGEKPKPIVPGATSTPSTTIETSEGIQKSIESLNPTVANLSKPLFTTLDSLRQTIGSGLVAGVQWANSIASEPNDSGGIVGTAKNMGGAGLFWFFSALLYVVSNRSNILSGLCVPLLLFPLALIQKNAPPKVRV
jgi:hypothetical protein